ncbi:hypothetical protein C6499_21125 [Candidatus Poribacteria bacterium]|nr:MAG: hypothetical protein C6499_21125 [Candidatus Poribacteria bacterium]
MKTGLMKLLPVFLCITLLASGCGSDTPETDETVVTPTEQKKVPSYYPDAIGNRWVYREANGFEWERTVSEERVIQGRVYRVFDYNPPIEDAPFDYLKTPSYRVTQNRVLFFVGEEINRYFEVDFAEALETSVFPGENIEVKVRAISAHELIFFRIPPISNFQWDVLDLKVKGDIIFLDLDGAKLPFEIHHLITGAVIGGGSVQTPAGNFETTAKIQYKSQITTSILDEEETTEETTDTVWLAPGVGIVKVENEDRVVELIEYSVQEEF